MNKFFRVLSSLGLIAICALFFCLQVVLEQNCTGHLKRAADANTIELAKTELAQAISYLEQEGDTVGYTSVIYKTPDEDVAFWYHNLKASYAELCSIPEDASILESSNTLMKLRETLVDSNDHGKTEVTVPPGFSRFPNNIGLAILFWILCLIWLPSHAIWYVKH